MKVRVTFCLLFKFFFLILAVRKNQKTRGLKMTQKELLLLREARNRYQREWRAKNREKVRGYLETYWLKKAKRQVRVKRVVSEPLNREWGEFQAWEIGSGTTNYF